MRRFITQNKPSKACDDWYAPEFITTTTVIEPDSDPVPTGLLDKHGNDICSVEIMDPIGFVTLQERD